MFPAEVNSNLLSQLNGKSYRGRRSAGPIENFIVYILRENRITGLGVCLSSATVIVHRDVIGDKDMVDIYIREKNQIAYAQFKSRDGDFALLLVSKIVFIKAFRTAMGLRYYSLRSN